MKQSTLDSFLHKSVKNSLPIEGSASARESSQILSEEVLTPLFIRPIPEKKKYRRQLKEEFALIDKNNFTRVFLQVRTILHLIEELSGQSQTPILHVIRGSAGSSLVCYFLGITHIDPLLHKIQLARFMNEGRTDMPDIDIDVPYNRREEIYAKIAERWPGMVARISNHVKYTSKVALREVVKEMLDLKTMPSSLRSKDFSLAKFLPNSGDQQRALKKTAEMIGKHKHFSKHCGGIVIFENEGAVPEELVLEGDYQAGSNTMKQIRLDKDETEDAGFIKIDLLSNRGLAQLVDICSWRSFQDYPENDFATCLIFEKGWNIGITFGESRAMRKLFMELQPKTVEEVAVALALVRPAAAAEERKQDFFQLWKTARASFAENPLLHPLVYDDDAIVKIRYALGCSAAEADKWRKVFAKGNEKGIRDFRQKMLDAGHDRETSEIVISDLSQLVFYSFCKSHAISYAQLVWALAYWKAYTPHIFWTAALNHCKSEYRKWVHYREARCSGLLLSRSPPPYTLGTRDGHPALVADQGEQIRFLEKSPIAEFRELGYWTHAEFLPGCYLKKDSQRRLDKKIQVFFCGLIATGRVVHRDSVCTLLCIGVGNFQYIDLIIPDKSRGDLFRYALVKGHGTLKKGSEDSVEVDFIRGISLQSFDECKDEVS